MPVAQVTIYLPDDLARELRRLAKRSGQSLSSVVAGFARRQIRPAAWPDGFESLVGAWEGDLPVPEDPPPDEVSFVVRESRAKPKRPRR